MIKEPSSADSQRTLCFNVELRTPTNNLVLPLAPATDYRTIRLIESRRSSAPVLDDLRAPTSLPALPWAAATGYRATLSCGPIVSLSVSSSHILVSLRLLVFLKIFQTRGVSSVDPSSLVDSPSPCLGICPKSRGKTTDQKPRARQSS